MASSEQPVEFLQGTTERVKPAEELGTTGVSVYGGYVVTGEKDAKLEGAARYREFGDMVANVSIIAASLRFFLNLTAKAAWVFNPPEDSGEKGEEVAEFVQDVLNDMRTPWHRVVRRMAMFKFYGFSVSELITKTREDGKIGFLDIAPRPQSTIERWNLARSGQVLGCFQRVPQDMSEVYIPRQKLVYVVDDSLNTSPDGMGLFRHLIEPATRLRRFEQLESFGYEADLRGVPIGRGPFGELEALVKAGKLTAAQRTQIEAPLRRFIQNHVRNPHLGMIFDSRTWTTADDSQSPSGTPKWSVELMQGQGYGLAEVSEAIKRLQTEIARVLGTEHMLLGADKGSYGLSRDKTDSFGLIIDSTLTEIEGVVEKDIVEAICDLNGIPKELRPKPKAQQISYRDVSQLTSALKDMAASGVTMDRDDEVWNVLMDLLGLPHLKPMAEKDPDLGLGDSTPPKPGAKPEDKPEPEDDTGDELPETSSTDTGEEN